jgi:outer membrane biosynthesis protein TonB
MTAPTDGPSYQDLLANIAQLSNEELAGLETQIAAAFQAADEADDMDGMAAAADAKDQVEAEAQKRGVTLNDPDMDGDNDESTAPADNPDVALDIAASADTPEATATVEPPAPVGDGEQPPEAETPAAGDEPPAEPTPTDDNPAEATAEADNEEEAKVDTPSVPEDRQPQPVPVAASNVITAAADVNDVSAGAPFTDRDQFIQAYSDKINAMRDARGDGEHVRVARITAAAVPDDRTLELGDFGSNSEKIAKALGSDMKQRQALIASGGYCAPLESRYDVFGIGTTDRPVKAGLPGFRAQRGGIRWITPPSLAGVTGSVGVWTAATDATPGGATKNKLIVACGAEQTVSISAVTLEMQFGNFVARAYPEMVARNVDLGLIAQARLAEQTLLTAMGTLSTAVTQVSVMGVARDFLSTISRAASAYRTRHRMDADAPLRIIVPAWVRDAIRDDIAFSVSPTTDDVLGMADTMINSYLTVRNVTVAWHLDDASLTTAQVVGVLRAYPSTFVWYMFAEGTFLFLDGGTLDIGVVRDSTLVGTNDYIQFTENFEAVAKVGLESLKITSDFALNGHTGAQV